MKQKKDLQLFAQIQCIEAIKCRIESGDIICKDILNEMNKMLRFMERIKEEMIKEKKEGLE